MSPYMKRFVYASLFYLGLAAVFGILDGLTNLGYFGSYAHTHFSLLGFMAMIVFGIGYFILPRFNGTELRFENWVPVHFWLANISLIGMVAFRGLAVETGEDAYNNMFIVSAALQVVSLFMFIINIWITLTPPKKAVAVKTAGGGGASSSPPGSFEVSTDKPIVVVNEHTPVAYLIDTLPALKQIMIDAGLKPLAMPGHIDMVRSKGVRLGTAITNHGMDFEATVEVIKKEFEKSGFAVVTTAPGDTPAKAARLTPATLIGEVIQAYPQSRPVFQKHFGSGCFDCPGQAYESIDMACRMHGVNPQTFLKELSEAIA